MKNTELLARRKYFSKFNNSSHAFPDTGAQLQIQNLISKVLLMEAGGTGENHENHENPKIRFFPNWISTTKTCAIQYSQGKQVG